MSRIKEKLSKIFSSQIPEFIRVGEIDAVTILSITTTASSKQVTVNDTINLIAGDKLQHPAITNTVYVTRILSSTKIEVSDTIAVTLTNQTAKFVRADTTSTFVKFLEAYYKFLEQDQYPQEVLQNSRKYGDSETTIDELVESFFKNYGNDIPRNIVADKRTFIKHFKDIYKTKGTEEAYRLLFRVMFNSSAEFFYPSTVILKASDGQWKKDYTLRLVAIQGNDPFDFKNTKIIGEISKATAIVNNVLKFVVNHEQIYELYLENIEGNFLQENIVATKRIDSTTTTTITALAAPQIIKIDILDGSAGYETEKSIEIYGGGLAKISAVDLTGKIQNIRIVEPSRYGTTTYDVSQQGGLVAPIYTPNPTRRITGNVVLLSNIGIYSANVAHGLAKGGYANISFIAYPGIPEQSITVSSVLDSKRFIFDYYLPNVESNVEVELVSTLQYTQVAQLRANVGIVKESAGYWLNSKGKLSELIYVQGPALNSIDRSKLFYQPFSYVVKSDVAISNWNTTALQLIHPGGAAVFGEIDINKEISSNAEATIGAEVWDYFGLTADSTIFQSSLTTYTNSRVINLPVTTDMVYTLFDYL
jgi:hypothetical protein